MLLTAFLIKFWGIIGVYAVFTYLLLLFNYIDIMLAFEIWGISKVYVVLLALILNFTKKKRFFEKMTFFAKIVNMVKNEVLRPLAKKVGQNSSRVYGRLPR